MTQTDVTALECCFPGCERPRAGGVLCAAHREAFDREEARRQRQGALTAMGVCKGCAGPIGAPNPDRDPRWCLRCWEEAEALHDEEMRRQARVRVRNARVRVRNARVRVRNARVRRDRQAAEAILRDIEALGPMRWWERVLNCVRVLLAVCAAVTLLWLWRGL